MLFFSQKLFFSFLILAVSFIIPPIGTAGLFALLISLTTGYLLGFDKSQLENGIYTYSAVLFGFGFAANYETGLPFYVMLVIGSVMSLLFSVAISSKLSQKNIPGLSLAFIITTWLVILSSRQFAGLGLTQRHIYWVNETYNIGGAMLVDVVQRIENIELPYFISGFLRSMSAIIFQGNLTTGLLLSLGLLVHSRIAFVLAIFGYAVALWFNQIMGGFNSGDISYYNLGTNFMLVAIALGGFYIIPSIRSFLWIMVAVPIAYLMVVGLGTITYSYGLPVFSLPFCITVILFLYCLRLRKKAGRLTLTPIQYYSPERNLYSYINGKERLMNRLYFPLSLPVMGEWMISQGHQGSITHKGEWAFALDFVILDDELKTFQLPATQPEHFYCYNKPVLSPGDGVVEEIIDFIDDNAIGTNNIQQNWGNTILIKHGNGLYSKLSHLKKNAFKVSKGAFVKKGEIIGYCGNSGRSPEPHLHFQIQSNPYLGSKTMHYPIAYFFERKNSSLTFESHTIPKEGAFVSNINPNKQLQSTFNFQPGMLIEVESENIQKETWEVMVDSYNEAYIYCKEQNSYAYFFNDGIVFYFTNFIGDKNSLLYLFYLSAYKILLSNERPVCITDSFPISITNKGLLRWIQDFTAPFKIFIKNKFESTIEETDGFLSNGSITINTKQERNMALFSHSISTSVIKIERDFIAYFSITFKDKTIQITCKKVS